MLALLDFLSKPVLQHHIASLTFALSHSLILSLQRQVLLENQSLAFSKSVLLWSRKCLQSFLCVVQSQNLAIVVNHDHFVAARHSLIVAGSQVVV